MAANERTFPQKSTDYHIITVTRTLQWKRGAERRTLASRRGRRVPPWRRVIRSSQYAPRERVNSVVVPARPAVAAV
jgi:hypothetical protein